MKALCMTLATFATAILNLNAGILAGPITNPANGHDYYLLTPETWTAAEAEAENLGGTLAIVRNADEQKWIFSTFGALGGTNRSLWIGLHRVGYDRALVWPTGEKVAYLNWAGGQPDDAGRAESCVFMASASRPYGFAPGCWDDYTANGTMDGIAPSGVVEVPGRSREASLTDKEKSLIGIWYESGSGDRPCYITGTENMLFAVQQGRAARLLWTQDEGLFLSIWNAHGEMIDNKILWSNGTWWSRKPSSFGHGWNAPGENAARLRSGWIVPD